jgi:hypothetical protein
LGFWGFGV